MSPVSVNRQGVHQRTGRVVRELCVWYVDRRRGAEVEWATAHRTPWAARVALRAWIERGEIIGRRP